MPIFTAMIGGTSNTTSTGPYSVSGDIAHLKPMTSLANGDEVGYFVKHQDPEIAGGELCVGIWNAGTLTRGTVVASTNSDNAVDWPAGGVFIEVVATPDMLQQWLAKSSNLSDLVDQAAARTNLGLEIGADVQAHAAALDATEEAFTTALKTKLDGLEDSKFLGTFVDLSALQTAYPSPSEGSYAFVDAGAASEVAVYIWDNSDSSYHEQAGASSAETPASIKTKLLNNADTNVLSDAELAKLSGIETGAEVNPTNAETETAYNAQVSEVSQAEAEAGIATTVRRWTALRVRQAINAVVSSPAWGAITGNLSDQTDLQNALDAKQDKPSEGAFVDGDKTKLDHISVTQAVDLDQMETDIAALANGMVYQGNWDASSGSFPGAGSAEIGHFYYVNVGGTVDGVEFTAGDNLVAIVDSASTSTYSGNWSKHDQTDAVQAVAGETGNISAAALRAAINVEDGAEENPTDAEIAASYNAEVAAASQAEAEAGTETALRTFSPNRIAQAINALAGVSALRGFFPDLPATGPILLFWLGQSDALGPNEDPGWFTSNPNVKELRTPDASSPTTYTFETADPDRTTGYVADSFMVGLRGAGVVHGGLIIADLIQKATGQQVFLFSGAQNNQTIDQFQEGGTANAIIDARMVDILADATLSAAGVTGPHIVCFQHGNANTSDTPEEYNTKFQDFRATAISDWGAGDATFYLVPISPLLGRPESQVLSGNDALGGNWDAHQTIGYYSDESVQIISDVELTLLGDGIHLDEASERAAATATFKSIMIGRTPRTEYTMARLRRKLAGPSSSNRVVIADPDGDPTATKELPIPHNMLPNGYFQAWQYPDTRAGGASKGYFADCWIVDDAETAIQKESNLLTGPVVRCEFGASGEVTIGQVIEVEQAGLMYPFQILSYYHFDCWSDDLDFVNRTYEVRIVGRNSATSTTNETTVVPWTTISEGEDDRLSVDLSTAFTFLHANNTCMVVLLRVSGGTSGDYTTHGAFQVAPGRAPNWFYLPSEQPADVLKRCQRYYWKPDLPELIISGHSAACRHQMVVTFPATMRDVPAMSIDSTGAVFTNTTQLILKDATKDTAQLELQTSIATTSGTMVPGSGNTMEFDARL